MSTFRCGPLYPGKHQDYTVGFTTKKKMDDSSKKVLSAYSTNLVTMHLSFAQCAVQMPSLPKDWDKKVPGQEEISKNDEDTFESVRSYRDQADMVFKNFAASIQPDDEDYYQDVKQCLFYNDRLLLCCDWSNVVSKKQDLILAVDQLLKDRRLATEHLKSFARHFDVLKKVVESTMFVKYGSIAFAPLNAECYMLTDIDGTTVGNAIVQHDATSRRTRENRKARLLALHYLERMSNLMKAVYDQGTNKATGSDLLERYKTVDVRLDYPDDSIDIDKGGSLDDLKGAIDMYIHLSFKHPQGLTATAAAINQKQPAWYGKSCANALLLFSSIMRPVASTSIPNIIALQRAIAQFEADKGAPSGEGTSSETPMDTGDTSSNTSNHADAQINAFVDDLEAGATVDKLLAAPSVDEQNAIHTAQDQAGEVAKHVSDLHVSAERLTEAVSTEVAAHSVSRKGSLRRRSQLNRLLIH